jgi:beta-glucosidase
VTFYKSVEQLPPFGDYSMANRTYRYFSGDSLFPFGYGLSYATFRYSNPRVSREFVPADGSVTISADVTNRSAMDGGEVVQLYLTHEGVAGAALQELHGFQRIHLAHGQTMAVTFKIRDRDFSVVETDGQRRIVNGTVKAWIGESQPPAAANRLSGDGVSAQFSITSERILPD